MEREIEHIAETINELIEKNLSLSMEKLSGTPKEIVNRSVLQVGILDELGIKYIYKGLSKKKIIQIDTSNLSLSEEYSIQEHLTEKQAEKLILTLQEKLLTSIRIYDFSPFLNYKLLIVAKITVSIAGVLRVKEYPILHYINEIKREKLLSNIENYIHDKIINGKYPNKELDVFFLSQHILDDQLYPNLDVNYIISVFDKIFELNKNTPALDLHRRNIINSLKKWVSRYLLPNYYNVKEKKGFDLFFSLEKEYEIINRKEDLEITEKDKSLIDLLIYTAILILKYEPNYSRNTGLDFLKYAEELGIGKIKEILKTGSGQFSKEESIYKDQNVECIANDILAIFTIKIKIETAKSYEKALQFINNLLQKGFPKSYQIKLSSKIKNSLPVKKTGKTKTQQFFANALQYPEIWGTIEQYARYAIHEFEWYEDAEDEFCAMPGTYAVFGLALSDEKYFTLLKYYYTQVDSEHQSVQFYFIQAFIEKWKVSTHTIPILVTGFLVCENIKPLKIAELFETENNLNVLWDNIQNLENYSIEHIVYFIWGKKSDLEKRIKKTNRNIQPYLTRINEKI